MDTLYRLGLPPEKLRRTVPLWLVRRQRRRPGERPFVLWFTVDEFRLPKEAAHSHASRLIGLDPDVWAQLECRPADEDATPIAWED
jgi:hypothetical protein